jgi:hypothetical protein
MLLSVECEKIILEKFGSFAFYQKGRQVNMGRIASAREMLENVGIIRGQTKFGKCGERKPQKENLGHSRIILLTTIALSKNRHAHALLLS